MYIDYAEFQAARGKTITIKEWAEKLDAFLKFNEQETLEGLGKVSHGVAKSLAHKEYEKYRVVQDNNYKSDFDNLIENVKNIKPDQGDDS